MGLLGRLAKSIPRASAQDAADRFLAGVGGGAAGAGFGYGLGGEDSAVPGMLAGAGVGVGARGLLAKVFAKMRPEEVAAVIKKADGGSPMPIQRPYAPRHNPMQQMGEMQAARNQLMELKRYRAMSKDPEEIAALDEEIAALRMFLGADDIAPSNMDITSMRGDDGQMHNYLTPRRK